LKNKQGILLLAVLFAAASAAFADNFPGHSKDGSKNVSFSEGFTGQESSQGNSAQCNFLIGSWRGNGLSPSSIADTKGSDHDTLLGSGLPSGENTVKLVDFGGHEGASSDKDKGKAKHVGESADGTGSGFGTGATPSVIAVAEPGSQSLLLFGLAGVGLLFHRRKTLANSV
jgi:hypothetical protein